MDNWLQGALVLYKHFKVLYRDFCFDLRNNYH